MDTSVFVSALRSNHGASFKLLSLIGISPHFEVNLSVPLILEYEDVAKRQLHITGLSTQNVDATQNVNARGVSTAARRI